MTITVQSKFSHDFSPTSWGQCKRTPDRGQQTTKGPDYGLVQATRARAKQINHFFVYITGTPIGAYPLNQICSRIPAASGLKSNAKEEVNYSTVAMTVNYATRERNAFEKPRGYLTHDRVYVGVSLEV